MKNSNDTIGNRTRDLPTCSAMPQPTALPRTPIDVTGISIYHLHFIYLIVCATELLRLHAVSLVYFEHVS